MEGGPGTAWRLPGAHASRHGAIERARPGAQAHRHGGRRCIFVLALVLLGAGLSAAARAGEPGPDTMRVRIETGAGTDLTNELYYQDAFLDTTFLGRQRVSTPEARYAGILVAAVEGTRGERRVVYQLRNELSLGDRIQRDGFTLNWRDDFAEGWRLALLPSIEWRHDQTFGRDEQEWRGAARGRLRRDLSEATTAELGLAGDVLRAGGPGSEFLLDRDAGRASLAFDHLGLLGDEWRLGYALAIRAFPDSTARDHLEHEWEGRWRHPFLDRGAIAFETGGHRRQTRKPARDSRDAFWDEAASLEGEVRVASRWGLRSRAEVEAMQYDRPDSTSFFDYTIVRGRLAVRYELEGRWSLGLGPRGEILSSRLAPGEGYHEIGGALEFERLGAGALWSLTPAAGWREYDHAPDVGVLLDLHSSFAFYELDGFVDQRLPERLSLRATTSLRYERHTDPSEDGASLYLSLELRWLAR